MTTGTAENQNEHRELIFGIPLVDLPTYKSAPDVGTRKIRRADFINFPLLDEILAYVKAHPMQWNQDDWFKIVDLETGDVRYESEKVIVQEINSCGAAMCFAGHAALRMGFPAPPKNNGQSWSRKVDSDDDWADSESVETFARNVLGLTADQGEALFAGNNTLQDLEDIIEALRIKPNIAGWQLEDMRDYREDQSVRDYVNSLDDSDDDEAVVW